MRWQQKLVSSRRALADAADCAEPEGAVVCGERAAQERAQQPGGAPDVGAEAAPAPTPPQPAQTADAGEAEAAHGAATDDAAAAMDDAAAAAADAVVASAAASAAAVVAATAKGKRDAWWKAIGLPLVSQGDAMLAAKEGRGQWRLTRRTSPEEAQKVYMALTASLKNTTVLHEDDTHRRTRILSTSKQLLEAIEHAVMERNALAAAGGISRAGGAAPERAPGGGQLREPASGSPGRAARVAGGEEEGDPAGAADAGGADAAAAGPARAPGPRGDSSDAAAGRHAEESSAACGAPTLLGRGKRPRRMPLSQMAFDEDDENNAAELAAERAAAAAQAPLSLPEPGAISGKRRRMAPSWLSE